MPNLIGVQKQSYDAFLQAELPHEERDPSAGLMAVFNSIFPIKNAAGTVRLEFLGYSLGEPEFDEEECRQRDRTYAAPLEVTLRLDVFDVDERTGEKLGLKDSIEQPVYLGEVYLMTENGSLSSMGRSGSSFRRCTAAPASFLTATTGARAPQARCSSRPA